ncbi:AAA domain-containing protein [Amylocystis lapponica]|nr:AAA domain-containing protein [Amylocystis lapponica]
MGAVFSRRLSAKQRSSAGGSTAAFATGSSPENRKPRAIFILGPSSSGKTTLCNALVADLGLHTSRYIREVARNVMKTHGFTRADTDTYEMQYEIMIAQLRAEEVVLHRTVEDDSVEVLLVSDRSAIDPIVYAAASTVAGASDRCRMLLGNSAFQAILPFYRDSLFVILQPVPEWVQDDGVRSLEDPRRYSERLVAMLNELGISFTELGADIKDIKERVEFTKRALSCR